MTEPTHKTDTTPVDRVGSTTTAAQSTALMKSDELGLYLSEIRRYPLLSREEELSLATSFYEDGDVEAGRKLVTGNLRLVVKIAMEYRRAWVNVLDLIQEGNVGLSEAVKRYDPYRGVRFSSFARYWIRALILQFILKNFRMVSFANTRAGRKLFFRLEKERNRLLQLHGEATPKMLADNLDVTEDDVVAATLMRQPVLSLNAPRGRGDDEGRALGDSIPDQGVDVEEQVINASLMGSVDALMKTFAQTLEDEREKLIWSERLICEDPVALAELGRRFGVSRERVRQLEARLKKRLREYLTEQMGDEIRLAFVDDRP